MMTRRQMREAGMYAVEPVASVVTGPVAPIPAPEPAVAAEAEVVPDWSGLEDALHGRMTPPVVPIVAASAIPEPAVTTGPAIPIFVVAPTQHAPASTPVTPLTRQEAQGATRAPSTRRARSDRTPRQARGTRQAAPPATSAAARSWRQRISVTGTMVLVGGLFATLTLPAYADNNAPTAQVLAAHSARVDAQSVSVDAAVTTTVDKRDSYGATSATDLRQLYADAIRQQNMQAYLNSGAKALGDDYPWPDQLTVGQGGGLSPLHYFYRECVDFVAWRLNRDAGSTHAPFRWDWSSLTPSGGNASQWKYAWQAHGWATGATPKVGAVAWFPGQNHVAYVSGLLGDGSVLIEEYNGMGTHVYGQRIILASDAYYLYAPPA